MIQKQWFVYNTITNPKKVEKWMDKYKLYIQEKIGAVWYFGTANTQKTKY